AALLPMAAGSLALAMIAMRAVVHQQPEHGETTAERAVIGGSAWEGVRAVFRSPYLVGIAVYVLALTVIATFIYFTRVQMVAALGEGLDARTTLFARI